VIPNELPPLPDEIFEMEKPANEREALVKMVDCLEEIATRAHNASQDGTLTEADLRALLEDIALDAAGDFIDARKFVEDDKPEAGPSAN
jgi:hypothetical protein